MQLHSALVILFVAFVALTPTAASSQEQPSSPCDIVRCGWGARCEVNEEGQPRCVCPSACPLYYQAICGSDGKTYGNTCMMTVAGCKSNTEITKVHDGECADLDSYTSPPFVPTKISPGIGLPKSKCTPKKPVPQ